MNNFTGVSKQSLLQYGRRWAARALALEKADEWKAQYCVKAACSSRSQRARRSQGASS
jgi:hypothetical protein